MLAVGGVARAISHGAASDGQPAAIDQASVQIKPSPRGGASPARAKPVATHKAVRRHRVRHHAAAATPTASAPASPSPSPSPAKTKSGYANPLRSVSGLLPERIDMGVDFGGSGPVYALGNAVITNATGDSSGWPGGGWITYRMLSGPAAGLTVYLAEDVRPDVQVGEKVTSATVIATMFNGSSGIETGWAMSDGASAESQLSEAGGISGNGPFPTRIGINFEELLQSLGVSAGPNRYISPFGVLPSSYPSWSS